MAQITDREVPSGQLHRLASRSGFATWGPSIFLVVILVDDAAVNKYLHGLGFWFEGALVEG